MPILPESPDLIHYLNLLKPSTTILTSTHCPSCGLANPWRHGSYSRKADRASPPAESLNPIPIRRFFCKGCKKTHSLLPDCIPPKRWYLWAIQQAAFLALLAGKSLTTIAKQMAPSRQTIGRWWERFKAQFLPHHDALCGRLPDLGRTEGFADFWRLFFKSNPLSLAMRWCHHAGVAIP